MYLTEVSRQFMQERNLIPKAFVLQCSALALHIVSLQIPELVSYWWDETEAYTD